MEALVWSSRRARLALSARGDHDLRRAAGSDVPAYLPDALVQIATHVGPIGIVAEIDTGSENARCYAERKGRRVQALHEAGASCWGLPQPWRPLPLAAGERRLCSLAGAMVHVGGADLWLGTELRALRDRDLRAGSIATLAEVRVAGSAVSTRGLAERLAKVA